MDGADWETRNRIDQWLNTGSLETETVQDDDNAASADERADALREAGVPEAVIRRQQDMARNIDRFRYSQSSSRRDPQRGT